MPNKKVTLAGILNSLPQEGSGQGQSTDFKFDASRSYPLEDSDTVQIASTDGSPFILQSAVVPAARFLAIRVLSGVSVKVKLTSAAGIDQTILVSSLLIWDAPTPGDEITSIKLVGTATLEYFLAGDAVASVAPQPSGDAIKLPVRVATTAAITLSGLQTIDGVSVVAGDRVLVKDQAAGADNGIYVAATGAWSRAGDFDDDAEVTAAVLVAVEEGTVNADTVFILATDNPITVGTTALTFTLVSGGTAVDSRYIVVSANRGSATVTSQYLRQHDGVPMNLNRFILPFDATLIAMSAACNTSASWVAEVHNGLSLVAGATLSVTAATSAFRNDLTIDFSAGDDIELFMNGTSIDRPGILAVFRRRN